MSLLKLISFLQFGLIIFNEKAETPNGCYGDQLVPITHRTRQSLQHFMNSRIAAGGAHFAKGLHRAFAYFKSATDGKHRGQHTNLIHVNLYNTLGSFPQQTNISHIICVGFWKEGGFCDLKMVIWKYLVFELASDCFWISLDWSVSFTYNVKGTCMFWYNSLKIKIWYRWNLDLQLHSVISFLLNKNVWWENAWFVQILNFILITA